MKSEIGKKAVTLSWQNDFPETTRCKCGGLARIAFAVMEKNEDKYVCNLHKNEGKGGWWPHDGIAVAVYFCKKCFEPVTLWNQA